MDDVGSDCDPVTLANLDPRHVSANSIPLDKNVRAFGYVHVPIKPRIGLPVVLEKVVSNRDVGTRHEKTLAVARLRGHFVIVQKLAIFDRDPGDTGNHFHARRHALNSDPTKYDVVRLVSVDRLFEGDADMRPIPRGEAGSDM